MEQLKKFWFSVFSLVVICLCFPSQGFTKAYQWKDFTKPFKTDIRFGSKEKIIEVNLPEELLRNNEKLSLIIKHNGIGVGDDLARRLHLSINEQAMADGYEYGRGNPFTRDPVKIIIETKDLKPGLNKLRFKAQKRWPGGYIDLYELHFDIPEIEIAKSALKKKPLESEDIPERIQPSAIEKEAEIDSPAVDTAKITTDNKIRVTATRWALVVGVSEYKDTRIPSLRYAANDAKAFYDWLVSPAGGKYAPARVKLLTNRQATEKNIKDALFVWLGQAIEEDVVMLYFACHGSPQSPDTPENLFLLPYDTQYDRIATTGFPMWDIETALKRFIKAKRVIVITDACHAGGVGQAFDVARRGGRGLKAVPISSSLQNLSHIGDGICIITASDDDQFSQESKKWGGGHGVFTYYLLKGLKGNADYNKDRSVSLGEIIPFLSEQVRRETRNAQTPTVAGRFDPALTIGK